MGMKVAFIFAPIAVLAALWTYFCLPECKGLRFVSFALRFKPYADILPCSLEQLDVLFEKNISAPRSAAWGLSHRDQPVVVNLASNAILTPSSSCGSIDQSSPTVVQTPSLDQSPRSENVWRPYKAVDATSLA